MTSGIPQANVSSLPARDDAQSFSEMSVSIHMNAIACRMAILLASLIHCAPAAAGDSSPQETHVYLVAGELNYVGPLSAAANAKAFSLFDAQEVKPTLLSIRSPGGNTDVGMELGNWVRQKRLTVKVMEVCFSSCANYVFTAAVKKIVSNFAVVGYHGGLSSQHFKLDEATEASLSALPSDERESARAKLMESVMQHASSQMTRERQFFDSIGVQQRITTLGQADRYRKLQEQDERALGWYYSVEDFAKLGVSDIAVINPPWRPRFITSPYTVFKVDVDE